MAIREFSPAEYHRGVTKDFRFGVGLRGAKSMSSVQDEARRAEDLGFDVLHLPDHIGAPAPFPTLMAAAAATKTLRMGTFVLNACFYKPALLARDVQALRDLSDGRFELGLGAGYAQHEFEAAELRYPSARERIDYLAHVTEYMGEHLPDVPVLIAGNGDRLLTVAARQANIIGLTGGQLITKARMHWPSASTSSAAPQATASTTLNSTSPSPGYPGMNPGSQTCR